MKKALGWTLAVAVAVLGLPAVTWAAQVVASGCGHCPFGCC
jgi:hypothetical protein